MANTFQTTTLVANMMTDYFDEFSTIVATCNDDFQKEFDRRDMAINGQLLVKVPGYPAFQTGLSVTATPIDDVVIPYTITEDDIRSVTYNVNIFEERFKIVGGPKSLMNANKRRLIDNYAFPAFQTINGGLEQSAAHKLLVYSMYTPIDTLDKLTGINSFASVSQLNTFFDSIGFPTSERSLMMNFYDAQKVADSQQNQFNPSLNKKITENAYVGGSRQKGRFAGFDAYKSQGLVSAFVAGALSGVSGITVDSISADGTQITLAGVDAVTSQLVNAGDMFAIGTVNLIHYVTKQPTPYTLVAKAFNDADGNGDGTVTIDLPYPLLFAGMHAWINQLPANGDPVVFYPNVYQNYGYTKSGMSLVSLLVGDVAGAENSKQEFTVTDDRMSKTMPFKIIVQGAALELSNNFRITNWAAVQPFTPYIASLPSLASNVS